MTKQERQQLILNLIRTKNIATQEELGDHVAKGGLSVTQSSVSRDLDELGIVKTNGFYSIPHNENNADIGLQTLEIAGDNLVVAKCASGLASAVCVLIDREKFDEIVGTVAGDDTIFIAVRDRKGQKAVLRQVWEMFEK
jgi:transcriptional regulator of arginine metabolism